jgi:hypothetical protein
MYFENFRRNISQISYIVVIVCLLGFHRWLDDCISYVFQHYCVCYGTPNLTTRCVGAGIASPFFMVLNLLCAERLCPTNSSHATVAVGGLLLVVLFEY